MTRVVNALWRHFHEGDYANDPKSIHAWELQYRPVASRAATRLERGQVTIRAVFWEGAPDNPRAGAIFDTTRKDHMTLSYGAS